MFGKKEAGCITIFQQNCFVLQYLIIPQLKSLVCHQLGVSKNLMHKRGLSRFSVDFFCLTVPKTFVGEPFSAAPISGIEKQLCLRGLCHDVLSNFFCLSTEIFRRGTFKCVTNFGYRNFFGIRKGGMEAGSITIFCQNFLSHIDEKFRRGTLLCFREFLVSKNVRDKRRGGYHDLPSKLFFLAVPKNFVGEPFSALFRKTSGSEKIYG